MAQRAEKQDFVAPLDSLERGVEQFPRTDNSMAPVFQLPQPEPSEYETRNVESAGIQVADTAKQNLAGSSAKRRTDALNAFHNIANTVSQLSGRAQRRAVRMKEERPMHIIGIAAGIAFVVGVALRIWRSSRYEP